MKLVKVKVIVVVPNEKGREKIIRLNGEGFGEDEPKKDSEGRTAQWYEDVGLSVPDELLNISTENLDEFNLDGTIPLEDDEIDILEQDAFFNADCFISCVANNDLGSTIYMIEDNTMTVKETPTTIYKKITKLFAQ